jgi:hypothetical protein
VDLGEGAGLGLKLVERVPLAALPHLLEHLRRRSPTPRRAKLLVTGREHSGGFRQRGSSGGGAGGSGGVGGFRGDEGAIEVREDEAAGGARVWRDDLADAVGGGLALHAGEEGDGVGELRLRGAVLRGAREAAEPRRHRGFPGTARRHRRRRRHRGGVGARVLGAGDGKRRRGGAFGGCGGVVRRGWEGTELDCACVGVRIPWGPMRAVWFVGGLPGTEAWSSARGWEGNASQAPSAHSTQAVAAVVGTLLGRQTAYILVQPPCFSKRPRVRTGFVSQDAASYKVPSLSDVILLRRRRLTR